MYNIYQKLPEQSEFVPFYCYLSTFVKSACDYRLE